MTNYKTFITDCCNSIVFALTMARDVRKFLKEEKKNDKLCLELV